MVSLPKKNWELTETWGLTALQLEKSPVPFAKGWPSRASIIFSIHWPWKYKDFYGVMFYTYCVLKYLDVMGISQGSVVKYVRIKLL